MNIELKIKGVDVIEQIKKTCRVDKVDIGLIFQDGYSIYYNGEYVCNLNNIKV